MHLILITGHDEEKKVNPLKNVRLHSIKVNKSLKNY